jgi:hypothetical protein
MRRFVLALICAIAMPALAREGMDPKAEVTHLMVMLEGDVRTVRPAVVSW